MVKKHSRSGQTRIQSMAQGKSISKTSASSYCSSANKCRHLSEKWATSYIAPRTKRRLINHSMTELSGIEHLILLDLLGASNPQIRSYFTDTAWLFDSLASAERRLHESGVLMSSDGAADFQSFFLPRRGNELSHGYIADDHIPFLRKGVNILHIIPSPFPSVWHTLQVSYESCKMTNAAVCFYRTMQPFSIYRP